MKYIENDNESVYSQSVWGDEEAKRNSHRAGHRGRYARQGEFIIKLSFYFPFHFHVVLVTRCVISSVLSVSVCQFEGAAGDEFQEQAAQLCSLQSQALDFIKNKQRKDPRFAHIIQVHAFFLWFY